MLAIIGAMEEEVSLIRKKMEEVAIVIRANMEFYKGKIFDKDVVVVRCGIGKVNAGICVQILADIYKVDGIINTGIAGSLKKEINIGDIVLSEDALQHDVDATGFGYALGQIPRMEEFSFQADKKLLQLARKCCEQVNQDIQTFTGRIVSGDQFISNKEKKEWLVTNFQGSCTEMEGAAIAQAAYLNHIPFLIVRAISDQADDSAKMSYEEFETQAILHSVKLILAVIKELP